MRLIDADMLLNSFKGAKKLGVDAIKYYVDNTPTIDLVRCGECKWWNEETHGCNRNPSVNAWWETDFCSYGERRTDDI